MTGGFSCGWIGEMNSQKVQKAREEEIVIERIRLLAYRPDEEPKGVVWLLPFQGTFVQVGT
jgi:hypothetical protein